MTRAERSLVQLLLISVPFFGFSLFNFGGLPFGRPDIIFGSALVLVFVWNTMSHRRGLLFATPTVAAVLLLFAGILSLLNSLWFAKFSTIEWFSVFGQILLGVVIFFVMSNLNPDRKDFNKILRVWMLVAVVVAAYALYQGAGRNLDWPGSYITLSNPSTVGSLDRDQISGFIRPTSFFFEPSRLGLYLEAPLLVLGAVIFYGQAHRLFFRRSAANYAAFLAIALALVATVSLGAYLATAVAASVFMVLIFPRRARRTLQAFMVLAVVFLSFAAIGEAAGLNVASAMIRVPRAVSPLFSAKLEGDRSTNIRLSRMRAALGNWRRSPIIGVGLNQAQFGSESYTAPGGILIQALASMGIVGFAAIVWVWGGCLSIVSRVRRRLREPHLNGLALGFLLAIWALAFDGSLVITQPILWTTLGLAIMTIRTLRRLSATPATERVAAPAAPTQLGPQGAAAE